VCSSSSQDVIKDADAEETRVFGGWGGGGGGK
jgi:hypothetical protein